MPLLWTVRTGETSNSQGNESEKQEGHDSLESSRSPFENAAKNLYFINWGSLLADSIQIYTNNIEIEI